MLSFEQVIKQMRKASVADSIIGMRETAVLNRVLADDERIYSAVSSLEYLSPFIWLIICTNKRLLSVSNSVKYGYKQKEIPLSDVSEVTREKGMLLDTVVITREEGETAKFFGVPKNDIAAFCEGIISAIVDMNMGNACEAEPGDIAAVPVEKPKETDRRTIQLMKLEELHKSGKLSDSEYERGKKLITEMGEDKA